MLGKLTPDALTDLVLALRGLSDRQVNMLRCCSPELFIDALTMAREADKAQGTQLARSVGTVAPSR